MTRFFILALLLLAATPALANETEPVTKWLILHQESALNFQVKQMGSDVKGSFETFGGDIAFDADRLPESKIIIDVNMASVNTEYADRDDTIRGSEWFDSAKFPTAQFASTEIKKTGDGTYEAIGTLTIRDMTVPVTLPFKLHFDKFENGDPKPIVDGGLTLDRSKFKLGGDKWADPSVIGNEVQVSFHIAASAIPLRPGGI